MRGKQADDGSRVYLHRAYRGTQSSGSFVLAEHRGPRRGPRPDRLDVDCAAGGPKNRVRKIRVRTGNHSQGSVEAAEGGKRDVSPGAAPRRIRLAVG